MLNLLFAHLSILALFAASCHRSLCANRTEITWEIKRRRTDSLFSNPTLFPLFLGLRMEAIKKKMQAMKVEKDNLCDRCDEVEQVR